MCVRACVRASGHALSGGQKYICLLIPEMVICFLLSAVFQPQASPPDHRWDHSLSPPCSGTTHHSGKVQKSLLSWSPSPSLPRQPPCEGIVSTMVAVHSKLPQRRIQRSRGRGLRLTPTVKLREKPNTKRGEKELNTEVPSARRRDLHACCTWREEKRGMFQCDPFLNQNYLRSVVCHGSGRAAF